jgi:hypothetical protein
MQPAQVSAAKDRPERGKKAPNVPQVDQQISPEAGLSALAIPTRVSAPPPDPCRVLQLQRQLGNSVTRQLLTPTHTPVLQRDLDAAQVQAALRHYTADPEHYTGFLIRRVQNFLSVPISGAMDEATVQAIALRQGDGGNGIVTYFQMLEWVGVGMERAEERAVYQSDMNQLAPQWASLSANDRLRRLAEAVNGRLGATGTPAPTFIRSDEMGSSVGRFTNTDWTVRINGQVLDTPALTADVVSTVYHEVRHAEQHWLAIRYLLQFVFNPMQHLNVALGIETFSVPSHVRDAATSTPELTGQARHLGRMFAYQFYQDAVDEDPTTLLGPPTEAYCEARDRDRREHSDESRRALDETRESWMAARRVYAAWWHEQDAHLIGDLVREEFAAAHPEAPRAEIDVCE